MCDCEKKGVEEKKVSSCEQLSCNDQLTSLKVTSQAKKPMSEDDKIKDIVKKKEKERINDRERERRKDMINDREREMRKDMEREMRNDIERETSQNKQIICSSRPDFYNKRYNECITKKIYGQRVEKDALDYCNVWKGCV